MKKKLRVSHWTINCNREKALDVWGRWKKKKKTEKSIELYDRNSIYYYVFPPRPCDCKSIYILIPGNTYYGPGKRDMGYAKNPVEKVRLLYIYICIYMNTMSTPWDLRHWINAHFLHNSMLASYSIMRTIRFAFQPIYVYETSKGTQIKRITYTVCSSYSACVSRSKRNICQQPSYNLNVYTCNLRRAK